MNSVFIVELEQQNTNRVFEQQYLNNKDCFLETLINQSPGNGRYTDRYGHFLTLHLIGSSWELIWHLRERAHTKQHRATAKS